MPTKQRADGNEAAKGPKPVRNTSRDMQTPLTKEIKAWYGDPLDPAGKVAKGFEKLVGKKITDVLPRNMIVHAASVSCANVCSPAATARNVLASNKQQTRASSGGASVGRTASDLAKAGRISGLLEGRGRDTRMSGVSATTSMKMRDLEALRVSSNTPTREQVAVMLANLLADIDSSTKNPTPTPLIKENKDSRWTVEERAERQRPNALTPSKQKRLHQLVRRYGKDSQEVAHE